MTDWHARVTTHLRQRALDLPDEVVEELAAHLEDAWEAAHGPRAEAAGNRAGRGQTVASVFIELAM